MTAANLYRQQWGFVHAPIWCVALLVFFGLSLRWMPMPSTELSISSGGVGGMYHIHAQNYVRVMKTFGIQATAVESAGTGENLKRLKDPSANIQVAFVQGGYALSEANQTLSAGIETIAQVDVEPVWVFSRFKDVDSLLRLQGSRVAIGQAGSGSRAVAARMFEQVRLESKDLILSESVDLDTVKALREGRIDAMIFVAAPEAPVVQALLQSPNVYLASLKRSAALIERLPYLDARFVAAGSLNAQTKQPTQDTALLTTQASLAVREDVHPMVKRILAATALEIHSSAGVLHKAGEFPHLKRVEFPSSAQARQVLRSGLPWLESSLGITLAQWAYRLLFIGIPLVLLAYALSQLIPAYLRWLMEAQSIAGMASSNSLKTI
ncbi:MAG: hypothetical protein HC765_04845 [Brachymonas sp.]|nr:hypothetical protein [Brachymonas sp.]